MTVPHHPQTLDPRRAGQVTRYHTWPRVREQSVGEHSWQVLRVLLAIWPDAPRHVMVHAVTHDVGETGPGDAPYPSKANSPVLKAEHDRIEREVHLAMSTKWSLPPPSDLTVIERDVFKMAEYIEMWEWGLGELELGNASAALVASRCSALITSQMVKIIGNGTASYDGAHAYVDRRRAHHDSVMDDVSAT